MSGEGKLPKGSGKDNDLLPDTYGYGVCNGPYGADDVAQGHVHPAQASCTFKEMDDDQGSPTVIRSR